MPVLNKLDLAVSINTAPTAIRVPGCVDEHSASRMFSRYLRYTPVLWVFGCYRRSAQ